MREKVLKNITIVKPDTLQNTGHEIKYCFNVLRSTNGTHIETYNWLMRKNLVNFYRRDFLSGTHSKYWLSFRFLNFLNRIPSPNLTRENISVEVFCKVESETGYYMLHNQHCHVRFLFRKLLPQIVMLQFICPRRLTIIHHLMRKNLLRLHPL